ncbi:S-layer homology domain-containing protein [Acutalibacter intestini]|uniref:S-layer homology domain-containing protein n=1 Tax=Acutalibacter intestini TaxID=3093659 RepID=UPI002AC99F47|nr:S-layer homology domain-containing protein [Acutalibacter sp. M00204]
MKKSTRLMAILLAIITVLSVLPMSALAANASFTDVPENAWFYEPVTYMAENGYMSGTGGKFSPNQTTTRAMFVTVLGRIAGVDQNQYKNTCTFRDVKKDWAEPYIAWAAENKIVNGLGDNKFGPNNYVTREQAALILFNYLKRDYTLTVSDEFLNKAPDKANVSSWALEAMKWATSAALMRGDGGGTLRPRYSATRAEIATIFKRFIEIKDDLEANKPDTPLGCDHVWETTETAMVDVVVHEDEENWVYMKDVDSMSICNGSGMDTYQWYVDNRDNYKTAADASEALSLLGDETDCPCHHGATNNFHNLDQVAPIIETKTYAAELPVMKKCTLCGTTKPWSTNNISNRDIWIEHTKEVVVREAWDEELYIDEDSEKFDEYGNATFVPAGSLIDTIHHPRYINNEVEYLENINTGEKIYVTVSSCKHPAFEYVSSSSYRLRCVNCPVLQPSVNELFQ